jgi:hypothetical protein
MTLLYEAALRTTDRHATVDGQPAINLTPGVAVKSAPTTLLDGLPVANFDWDQWGAYFETIDRLLPSN